MKIKMDPRFREDDKAGFPTCAGVTLNEVRKRFEQVRVHYLREADKAGFPAFPEDDKAGLFRLRGNGRAGLDAFTGLF